MKWKYALVALIIMSCEGNVKTKTVVSDSPRVEEKKLPAEVVEEPLVKDTGQVWFNVNITKNDSPYMNFEGTWPMLLKANDFATLQLSRSKNLMSVTDMLTLYINGLAPGKKTVLSSAGKPGEVSMIVSPVKDGAYGLPVIANKGTVNITKNDSLSITGHYNAEVTDANNDVYKFKGSFLNVKFAQ